MFPFEPHPVGDAPQHAAVRVAVEQEPERFVDIEPIPQNEQLGWMREFADSEPDSPLKTDLLEALQSGRPAASFAGRLRQTPTALRRWNRRREERVARVIEQWAQAHNVSTPIYEEPLQPAHGEGTLLRATLDEAVLRAQIHGAIDKMPLAELMRLPIPLEYFVTR